MPVTYGEHNDGWYAVADKPELKVLILDLEAVDQIDVTGEEMLTQMSEHLEEAGVEFLLPEPNLKSPIH